MDDDGHLYKESWSHEPQIRELGFLVQEHLNISIKTSKSLWILIFCTDDRVFILRSYNPKSWPKGEIISKRAGTRTEQMV